MPSDLIERTDKALRTTYTSTTLATDGWKLLDLLRECREALAQGQKRVEKAAVMLGLKIAEIDALRAQLAEAQADTARLDWLLEYRPDMGGDMFYSDVDDRAAIDALRTQPGSGEEGK